MASQSTIDATKNREVVPTAAHPPNVESVTDLAEICSWLGTYRERLRAAQLEDRERLTGDLSRRHVRYQERRPELA